MWIIVAVAFFLRLPFVWGGVIPFSFDHGRDSLAVLHMIKLTSLKFIGPWTSIPGLFFGPGWYYLLAPGFLLSQGHPLAGPIIMLVLSLVMIGLLFKYFGWLEALIMCLAPIWVILATGAANPYPMPFISLIILIVLKTAGKQNKLTNKQAIVLGLVTGLGFHFSSALAVFYLILMPLSFYILKIKLNKKQIAGGMAAFGLTWLPQAMFEIKNRFMQTKGLINYFVTGESQVISFGKIKMVTKAILHELSLAVLPDKDWLKWMGIGILIYGVYRLIKLQKVQLRQRTYRLFGKMLVLWLIIPTVGFWLLHFNPWYVYGLLPVVVIGVGMILKQLPKTVIWVYLAILGLGTGFQTMDYFQANRQKLLTHKAFLPAKLEAIEFVRQKSQGEPFSSYHYLPEIYDYAYQYLYLWQGFQGKEIPVEFSYQPKEVSYVTEKSELLSKLPETKKKPKKIFLIIEQPENKWHYPFDAWLNKIEHQEVIRKHAIGPELFVWELSVKEN